MIVTSTLERGQKPTPEQIKEIREAAKRPIVFDEDCPPMTDEQLADMAAASRERDAYLASLGLPPLSADASQYGEEVLEERRRQITLFWRQRCHRQRDEAHARRREAASA